MFTRRCIASLMPAATAASTTSCRSSGVASCVKYRPHLLARACTTAVTPGGRLAASTRVARQSQAATSTPVPTEVYKGSVDAGFNVFVNPNGGYLTGIIHAAMQASAGASHPDILTMSTFFVSRAIPDAPVEVHVRKVHAGRMTCMLDADLVQHDPEHTPRVLARSMATFGSRATVAATAPTTLGPVHARKPPSMAPFEDCDVAAPRMTLEERFDVRYDPTTRHPRVVTTAEGASSGQKRRPLEFQGYIRLSDGGALDASALLFLLDVLPPPVLTIISAQSCWVPTLEITTHIRKVPPPLAAGVPDDRWLVFRYSSALLQDGMVDGECELWAPRAGVDIRDVAKGSDDEPACLELVATARQLATVVPFQTKAKSSTGSTTRSKL